MILGSEIAINTIVQSARVLGGKGNGRTLRPVGVAEARARPLRSKVIVNISMTKTVGKYHAGYLDPSSITSWGLMIKAGGYAGLGSFRALYNRGIGA